MTFQSSPIFMTESIKDWINKNANRLAKVRILAIKKREGKADKNQKYNNVVTEVPVGLPPLLGQEDIDVIINTERILSVADKKRVRVSYFGQAYKKLLRKADSLDDGDLGVQAVNFEDFDKLDKPYKEIFFLETEAEQYSHVPNPRVRVVMPPSTRICRFYLNHWGKGYWDIPVGDNSTHEERVRALKAFKGDEAYHHYCLYNTDQDGTIDRDPQNILGMDVGIYRDGHYLALKKGLVVEDGYKVPVELKEEDVESVWELKDFPSKDIIRSAHVTQTTEGHMIKEVARGNYRIGKRDSVICTSLRAADQQLRNEYDLPEHLTWEWVQLIGESEAV